MRIDWFYKRAGWTSCKRAQEFLGDADVIQYGNATNERLSGSSIDDLLGLVNFVRIAKGKKIVDYHLNANNRKEIVAYVTGRSGTLRAPTLRVGDTLIVGFNEELYDKLKTDWDGVNFLTIGFKRIKRHTMKKLSNTGKRRGWRELCLDRAPRTLE